MKALGVTAVPTGVWRCEIKFDGYRAIALVNRGRAELWSRNRKEMSADYPEIVAALEKHRAWMAEHGVLTARRLARAAHEVETIAVTALRERIGDLHGDRHLTALAERIVSGETDPYRAADELVANLTRP